MTHWTVLSVMNHSNGAVNVPNNVNKSTGLDTVSALPEFAIMPKIRWKRSISSVSTLSTTSEFGELIASVAPDKGSSSTGTESFRNSPPTASVHSHRVGPPMSLSSTSPSSPVTSMSLGALHEVMAGTAFGSGL